MKIHEVIIALVIVLVFFSGCLSNPAVRDSAEGALHAHYEYSKEWSINQGCYERVTGYVYNAGEVPVNAVQLNLNLINNGTGTIRDSHFLFIGLVGKGETRTFEMVLDGECLQEYQVDFTFIK
jgi:PBP1b-binding outer membrane lipoprotein LpoB